MRSIALQNYGMSGWLWSSEQCCVWILPGCKRGRNISHVFLSCLAQDYRRTKDGKQRRWQIVDAAMYPHPSSEVQILSG